MNNEHYNLYIETDEEVTTIISRLSLARAQYVALIIPQHALVLQSIINLRLLAREAKKQKKEILIVTQDNDGMTFATRVGLPVVPLQQWQEQTKGNLSHSDQKDTNDQSVQVSRTQSYTADPETTQGQYVRESIPKPTQTEVQYQNASQSIHPQQAQQTPPKDWLSLAKEDLREGHTPENHTETLKPQEMRIPRRDEMIETIPVRQSSQRHDPQEKHFKKKKDQKKYTKEQSLDAPAARRFHKFGWTAVFICALSIIGFLLLPFSTVTVRLGDIVINEKVVLTGKASFSEVDSERRMLPLRLVEKELTHTVEVAASGKKDLAASKAYGTLTIFNSLSEKSQDLVATTRFEAPDGTIFRLAKNTTVPGMKKNGDKLEPGTIDVSVTADKPGVASNVDAADWTIPGFKSNKQKFTGFTAKSNDKMIGGSAGGKNASVATKEDLAMAEKKAKETLDKFVEKELEALVRTEEILLTEAVRTEIIRSESVQQTDTATDAVEYVMTAKVQALVFAQGDIDKIIKDVVDLSLSENGADSEKKVDFEAIVADFKDQKLSLTAGISLEQSPELNKGEFTEAIRGQRHSDIKGLLKEKYPYVNDILIKTYPPFPPIIGEKISRYTWMTRIKTVEQE